MHVGSVFFKWFQVFSHVCCKCFIWMLHMFAMVFKYFSGIFANVSHVCFKCFICLLYMLKLLHQDVSKVDQDLNIGCSWEAFGDAGPLLGRSSASSTCWGAGSLAERVPSPTLTLQIGGPGANKSVANMVKLISLLASQIPGIHFFPPPQINQYGFLNVSYLKNTIFFFLSQAIKSNGPHIINT